MGLNFGPNAKTSNPTIGLSKLKKKERKTHSTQETRDKKDQEKEKIESSSLRMFL